MIENVKEKRGAKREMFAVAGITLFLAPFQVAQAFSLLVLFALSWWQCVGTARLCTGCKDPSLSGSRFAAPISSRHTCEFENFEIR